jgi:hypothetical protein
VSDQPPEVNKEKSALLAGDENERLSWQGILKESEDDEYPAQFIATDGRLIFSLGSGHFKDIGFDHVESVEVAANDESETKGVNPDSIIAVGFVLTAIGFGSMFITGFSTFAVLAGLCFIGLGAMAIWFGKDNYDELKDDLEVIEYTNYHVLLRTTAESPFSQPIYFETTENIGPELSKLVQENR